MRAGGAKAAAQRGVADASALARASKRAGVPFLVSCLVAGALGPQPAFAGASETWRAIDGRWRGSGVDILVDCARMQGNDDPARPFQRDSLRIRDVSGSLVTFMIGTRQFFAIVSDGEMRVSGGHIAGSAVLRRVP